MQNDPRQGDIFLFPGPEGVGNIRIINGEPVMTQGFESAVYISIDGDNGDGWWANEYLSQAQKVQSKFAAYRKGTPLTSGALLTGEELILQDLQWIIDTNAADKVLSYLSIIGKNKVQADIRISIDGVLVNMNPFQLNWKAQKDFPAIGRI